MTTDPHRDVRIATAGRPADSAAGAVLLVHGRGATAEGILGIAPGLGRDDLAFLAPQAEGHTWYPLSFLSPLERNEPHLSSALAALGRIVDDLERAGMGAERIVLLGFSQGACLATEFAARNPRRYGGVIGLSGGLIGPPGTPRDYEGSLARTPVFLGCSDIDPHIPVERVEETARVLEQIGGEVERRIYPGMGHTVNEDEMERVRALVARLPPTPG